MVNAWSLAASILDGTFEEDYPIMKKEKDIEHSKYWYDYTRNDPDRENPFIYESPDKGKTVTRRRMNDPTMKKEVIQGDYFEGRDENGRFHPDNPNQDFWKEDTYMTGNPSPDSINFSSDTVTSDYTYHVDTNLYGTVGLDTSNFALDQLQNEIQFELNVDPLANNGFWKYNEDTILKEVRDYLSSTYRSHYTSQESKTQTLDLIESIGDAEAFCRSNAIKYLSRFGKKGGKSKLDITKAIHYCILLWHFSGLDNETKDTYETF
tara:strand:+ start:707 stop:1498 length:792 start_codon:yes stop_codon:yes gene_type:complete